MNFRGLGAVGKILQKTWVIIPTMQKKFTPCPVPPSAPIASARMQTRSTAFAPEAARGGAAPASAPGLSMAHIRPHKDDWTFRTWINGALCEIKIPPLSLQRTVRAVCTKRGKIKGFSRGSRGRLLKTVGRLRQDSLPVFVTLTYPDEFPVTPERWRRDLAALWRRIRRQWPTGAAIWKKEFKRRKSGVNEGKVAPHYHMLLWIPKWVAQEKADWIRRWKLELARIQLADGKNLISTHRFEAGMEVKIDDLGPDVKVVRRQIAGRKGNFELVEYWKMDGVNHLTETACKLAADFAGQIVEPEEAIRSWFAVNWYEVVGSGEPRHLAAGTGVETVKSSRGVYYYASKYMADVKDDPGPEYDGIGRCWGIMGREHLPWATVVEMSLSWEQGIRLKRAAVRYLKSKRDKKKRCRSRAPGMWWLSSAPPAWAKLAGGGLEASPVAAVVSPTATAEPDYAI